MTFRVGIIGTGFAGTMHARSLRELPGVELACVAAASPDEAAPLAAECGARVARSAAAVCADDAVDVVVVATPTDLHADHAVAAANAGKHVFCEKPLARTLAQGAAIVEACAAAGVRLAVGHVVRHFPEYSLARELMRDGRIGRPALATLTRGSFAVGTARPWYRDPERSGGVVLDLMLHDLDTLRWWFGEPDRVYARCLGMDERGLDYALATLRFPDGLIAHVEASWAEHGGFRTSFEICGDRGMLSHDSRESTPLVVQAPVDAAATEVMPAVTLRETPYRRQLRDFFDRLQRREPFAVDGEEAYRSLALGFAVIDSAARGEPVAWRRP